MTKIFEEHRKAKKKLIFENALTQRILDHWKDSSFDSFEIKTEVISCRDNDLIFKYYELIKGFLKCPIKDNHTFKDLQKKYLTMFKQIDRRANCISFVK